MTILEVMYFLKTIPRIVLEKIMRALKHLMTFRQLCQKAVRMYRIYAKLICKRYR